MGCSPGAGRDVIDGSAVRNVIRAGAGNDQVDAGAGNDSIYGEDGNDAILGGRGHDFIQGGTGRDRLSGGLGHDRIYGGRDNDVLLGNDGIDYLNGGAGNDFLNGGNGNDRMVGGLGNDRMYGGAGDDRLNGFGTVASTTPQFDVLTGNAGSDTFILGGSWGVSYVENGDGYAVVNDWDPQAHLLDSEFDRIEVRDPATLGGGFYSLEFKAVLGATNVANNANLDTEIYFTDSTGFKDRIGIIQDSINVNMARDFVMV